MDFHSLSCERRQALSLGRPCQLMGVRDQTLDEFEDHLSTEMLLGDMSIV